VAEGNQGGWSNHHKILIDEAVLAIGAQNSGRNSGKRNDEGIRSQTKYRGAFDRKRKTVVG